MLVRVLIAVDDARTRRRFERVLRQPGVVIATVRKKKGIWAHVAAEPFDLLVISDSVLPQPEGDSIAALRALPDEPGVIVILRHDDEEFRANLLAAGCAAALHSGLSDTVLAQALKALIESRREWGLLRVKAEHPQEHRRLGDFVSSSPAMQQLIAFAGQVVNADTSLLILGETGVGKEWLARAIHEEGPRSPGTFIAVNCSAIPEALLESELFGHEEGAFTGATRAHRGYFELAHLSTVFLDEIAEMPTRLQAKLLRVLQERSVRRVGGEQEIDIDVRVMAATSRDLTEEIAEKRFRSDLYYRLGVVTLRVPPLRERREDVLELAQNYLDVFRVKFNRNIESIEPGALTALAKYDWPGNVRELINVMERAVLLCSESVISLSDFPEDISGMHPQPHKAVLAPSRSSKSGGFEDHWLDRPLREARREVTDAFERAYLAALLTKTGGRIAETARRAGITPRSLFDKMRRHRLRKEDFKIDLNPIT